MRYRQTNAQESSRKRIARLVDNDDALSTSEQEEVIRHFAGALRVSVQFMKVIACVHLLIAIVYLGLFFGNSSLVYVSRMDGLERVLNESSSTGKNPLPSYIRDADKITAQPRATGIGSAAQKLREHTEGIAWQTERQQLQNFFARSEGASAMRYTVPLGGRLSMLGSVVLFIAGGVGCWVACQRLKVNQNELISRPARELDRGAREVDDGTPYSSPSDGADKEEEKVVEDNSLRGFALYIWRNGPLFHRVLASISVWPATYWVLSMAIYHHRVRSIYISAGGPATAEALSPQLYFGITDSLTELALAVWEPIFHLAVGGMLSVMTGTYEKLHELANLKYKYDKM